MTEFAMTPRPGVNTPFSLTPSLRLKPAVSALSLYPHVVYVAPRAYVMPRLYRNQGYREFIRHGDPENPGPETEWYGYMPYNTTLESAHRVLDNENAWIIPIYPNIENADLSQEYSRNPGEQLLYIEYDDTGGVSSDEQGGRPDFALNTVFTDDFANVIHGPKGDLASRSIQLSGEIPFTGLFRTQHIHYSDFSGLWNDGGTNIFVEPTNALGHFYSPNAGSSSPYLALMESGNLLDALRYVYEFSVTFYTQDAKGRILPGRGKILSIERFERTFYNDALEDDPVSGRDISLGTWRQTTISNLIDRVEIYSGSGLTFSYFLEAPAYAECYVPNGAIFKGLSSDPLGGINALYVELFFKITADIGGDTPAVGWVVFHLSPVISANWAGAV